MTGAQADRLLGVGASIFALAYIAAARAIEDSLLSDAVGAGGVPQAAGIVLLLASVALVVKSWFASDSHVVSQPGVEANARRPVLLSAALAAVLVIYVWLLPLLGYIVSVSLLVLAVALLAGARQRTPLALCTLFAGVALWAMFELALKIRMPVGRLFS